MKLVRYYSLRASEYEQVYHRDDPVRRRELAAIAAEMREVFIRRRVLEVACGTGYWTAVIADVAQHVVAIDLSAEMLEIAREKGLPAEKVVFLEADVYALKHVPGTFDAGLANFWFSHVSKARIDDFLDGFHARLGTGARVFMADNVYIPSVGGELVTKPGVADTFKIRELADGSVHEVLKNYYDEDQLRTIFEPRGGDLRIHVGECYWWLCYHSACRRSPPPTSASPQGSQR